MLDDRNAAMPTLEEWEQALVLPRRVTVKSSDALIKQVEKRHVSKDTSRAAKGQQRPSRKPTLSAVAEFMPNRVVDVVPAQLLERLGVATTPPVDNLVDVCSTWAYLRYLWAFEITGDTNAPLRLSEDARSIDFHQKGLLSDQIGIGMSALILGQYLDAPFPVDVSVAMNDPAWPIVQQYDASPDYIFFNALRTRLFIVECKGTQTSHSNALEQLRRGTEQVPSLIFTDRPNPPLLVVATCLSKSGTQVLVIDPPSDDSHDDPKKRVRISERQWRVRNTTEFQSATRWVFEAKMLRFAGAIEGARRKVDRAHVGAGRRLTAVPRELVTTENELGTFRGIRQRVPMIDGFDVEVTQALEIGVMDAMLAEDTDRTDEHLRRFQFQSRTFVGEPGAAMRTFSRHDHGLVVGSAGPGGSMLEIHVTPP